MYVAEREFDSCVGSQLGIFITQVWAAVEGIFAFTSHAGAP